MANPSWPYEQRVQQRKTSDDIDPNTVPAGGKDYLPEVPPQRAGDVDLSKPFKLGNG